MLDFNHNPPSILLLARTIWGSTAKSNSCLHISRFIFGPCRWYFHVNSSITLRFFQKRCFLADRNISVASRKWYSYSCNIYNSRLPNFHHSYWQFWSWSDIQPFILDGWASSYAEYHDFHQPSLILQKTLWLPGGKTFSHLFSNDLFSWLTCEHSPITRTACCKISVCS